MFPDGLARIFIARKQLVLCTIKNTYKFTPKEVADCENLH